MAICLFALVWCQYDFIYLFCSWAVRLNRRYGGFSLSLEVPSLGSWDNTECIDHLERCSPPSKDHKAWKGESAVLHNSEQLPICWEIHWCCRMMPLHRNWWCSPQSCFFLIFGASSRLLIFPAKLVLFLCISQMKPWVCQMKGEKKKGLMRELFSGLLTRVKHQVEKENFKAEIATVLTNQFIWPWINISTQNSSSCSLDCERTWISKYPLDTPCASAGSPVWVWGIKSGCY